MTQQPAEIERRETATEAEMARKVQNAIAIGTFPQNTTPEQIVALARVAAAYGLDPLMQELIPYQGKPFITIAGRRRLDNAAGYRPSITFRFLTADEKTGYTETGALVEGDLVQICILTEADGRTVEGLGRSLAIEAKGHESTPQVARRIEMAQKRAERRAREMAYGPVPRPAALGLIQVMEEGDEAHTVESRGWVVEETVQAPIWSETVQPTAEDIADAGLGPVGQNIAPPIDPPKPATPPKPRTKAQVEQEMRAHQRGEQPPMVEGPDTGDLLPVEH